MVLEASNRMVPLMAVSFLRSLYSIFPDVGSSIIHLSFHFRSCFKEDNSHSKLKLVDKFSQAGYQIVCSRYVASTWRPKKFLPCMVGLPNSLPLLSLSSHGTSHNTITSISISFTYDRKRPCTHGIRSSFSPCLNLIQQHTNWCIRIQRISAMQYS